jgi:uncharacterized coiled-coil DUF342 family protein
MSDQEELDYLRTEVDRLRKLYLKDTDELEGERDGLKLQCDGYVALVKELRAERDTLLDAGREAEQITTQLSQDLGRVAAERDKLVAQLRHTLEPIAERAVKDERDRWKERAFSAEDTVRRLEEERDKLTAERDELKRQLAHLCDEEILRYWYSRK